MMLNHRWKQQQSIDFNGGIDKQYASDTGGIDKQYHLIFAIGIIGLRYGIDSMNESLISDHEIYAIEKKNDLTRFTLWLFLIQFPYVLHEISRDDRLIDLILVENEMAIRWLCDSDI
ncbi:hypothetical protein L2E82_30015 [Cichorium intybus]|uniref:Uncharacterized protein n=1 Tax=Cichorium intybus TaxID=13427 RepID=A0ACB9CZC9_CICIN|nr:hypothetical protein L2E82_30015 [Cichorium intybus]